MAIRRQSIGSTHDTPRANTPIGSVRSTAPRLPARERALILGLLLLFAAICWTLLLRRTAPMAGLPTDGVAMGGMSMGGLGITQGMHAAAFMAMWVIMMIAMMFPSAAPMILMFAGVHGANRMRGQAFVPTWIFVGGYLVVWTLFGVLAYALAAGAERLATGSPWVLANAGRFGGAVIIAAGLYQLSPPKNACLSNCRSPLQWVLGSWREGYGGAFRMGLEHGATCVGCCWLLFVILFPLGVMNVVAMAVLTALIYAERSRGIGRAISRVAAAALIVYGTVVVVVPRALPTVIGNRNSAGMNGAGMNGESAR